MWKTVLILLGTLIAVPILAYQFDTPPNDQQWNIIFSVTKLYLGLASLTFVVSILSKNYSQVDKLWSIVPAVYAWQITYLSDWEPRLILFSTVITVWAARLTYNFARRGGYSWRFWEGEEDYRWAVLRAKPEFQAPWKWFAFNLFFISLYQMGLILLIVFPLIKGINGPEIGFWDWFLASLILVFIGIEFVADQQQYDFQTEKYRRINAKEDLGMYADGFIQSGFWGKVRHPNYAAEQTIWLLVYFSSVVVTGVWINWSIAGTILLCLLFFGSSNFSEEISAKKYPKYQEYQKRVKRFIPKIY
jgi:steroid 5-alpha reductase family enzyme